MTEKSPLAQVGITAVAIVETSYFNIPAYQAHCLSCDWRCHREPHAREATAIKHAKDHVCPEQATPASQTKENQS